MHVGVRRTEEGVRVALPTHERELLQGLPHTLRDILLGRSRPEFAGRLFPPGSRDPEVEREYRELVGDDLVQARLAAVDRFADTLEQGRQHRRMWVVDLDDEQADAWLSTINDLRLVLAPLAGVDSEDAWAGGPDRSSPESMLLWHLSWLQEELLEALMQGLPEPADPDD
jgi:Domain of unknown function (DUF2017)